jgi:hypothetical protein
MFGKLSACLTLMADPTPANVGVKCSSLIKMANNVGSHRA